MHHSWLIHYTGGGGANTLPYLELSGFLSIILPLMVQALGVTVLYCWHHQCAVHHCYWPTRRFTAAHERACWRHSPTGKRTARDIHDAHHAALRRTSWRA